MTALPKGQEFLSGTRVYPCPPWLLQCELISQHGLECKVSHTVGSDRFSGNEPAMVLETREAEVREERLENEISSCPVF